MLAAHQSAFAGAQLRSRAAARPAPAAGALLVEAAHKKGGGSSKNKDDSHAQRLGVKLYGDQPCIAGNIIIRQRGTTWTPGPGTMMGRDHTIFAVEDGMVKFDRSSVRARIMVVKEEAADAAPAKETARTRKFAKFPPRNSAAKEEAPVAR